MASRRGLSAEEIQKQLDRLLAEDEQKDVLPGVPTDVQSDAEEGDTEYEEDSEDEVADITDPLQHLSCGLAPVVQIGQGVGMQPDIQVAGSSKDTSSVAPRFRLSALPPRTPQPAGSSKGITGSSAPGWRPDLPPMPSDPSDPRTSPYPSKRSEHRTPATVSKLSIIFNALDLNDISA